MIDDIDSKWRRTADNIISVRRLYRFAKQSGKLTKAELKDLELCANNHMNLLKELFERIVKKLGDEWETWVDPHPARDKFKKY